MRLCRTSTVVLACLCLAARGQVLLAATPDTAPHGGGEWDFERDVRSVFRAHCLACHGPEDPKGGLRLDSRGALLGGDPPAVVPGRPEESELVRRLRSTDDDERMPRKAAPLAAAAIDRIAAWIADGAPWPEGGERALPWAWRPLVRPSPPDVMHVEWCRNELDRFVLARLEKDGLAPPPAAPRAALVRRLHLDLTGLPPTLAELDQELAEFAHDGTEALARTTERLLRSSAHAEHEARAWMDLARYADTNGYEKDDRRVAWPWRDEVIDAFARDQGFDQFTVEQLAGDLLPNPTRAQLVATGFHRNTLVNQEGGTDPEEFRYAAVVDRVNTTASVWLGTTLACAQCHDHKYDPLSQRDYFRFFAFFDQTEDTGNQLEPVLALPDDADARELERIARDRAELDAAARAIDADTAARVEALRADPPPSATWRALMLGDPPEADGILAGGAVDGSALLRPAGAADATQPAHVELGLVPHDGDAAPRPKELRLLRIEPRPLGDDAASNATAPERARVTLRLARLERGVRTPVPLARGTVERVAAVGGASFAARADGAVELDLDLPRRERDAFAALYLEPREPAAWDASTAWLLALDFERAPSTELRLVFAATDDAAAARRVGALEAAPWERAPARAIESTSAALAELDRDAGPPRIDAAAWTPIDAWRDARPIALEGERRLHVVRRRLVAREPVELELELGGDDAFRAWIDGERVAASDDWPGFLERQARVSKRLAAGEHVLVLAIPNSSGPGQFGCDLGRARGEHVPELVREGLREVTSTATRRRDELAAFARTLALAAHAERAPARGRLDEDERAVRARIPTTPVMRERATPRVTRLHVRGAYLTPGDVVEPGTPEALPPMPADAPRNRLGLARWLVDARNPLVARVAVNRVWERMFGRGLVATSSDFGTRGETAVARGAARLARRRLHGARVELPPPPAHDHELRDVARRVRRVARNRRARSGERAARARRELPARRGDAARRSARRERPPRRAGRRRERDAAAA